MLTYLFTILVLICLLVLLFSSGDKMDEDYQGAQAFSCLKKGALISCGDFTGNCMKSDCETAAKENSMPCCSGSADPAPCTDLSDFEGCVCN